MVPDVGFPSDFLFVLELVHFVPEPFPVFRSRVVSFRNEKNPYKSVSTAQGHHRGTDFRENNLAPLIQGTTVYSYAEIRVL